MKRKVEEEGENLPARAPRTPDLLDVEYDELKKFGGFILAALQELRENNQITNLELGVKGGILVIALAENTSSSNRLRAFENISRQEGMLNAKLVRGRIFNAKDATEAENWWQFLKGIDLEAAEYENFDDYQKGETVKRKEARVEGKKAEGFPGLLIN